MIYTDIEIKHKIKNILSTSQLETEVVEYKEARSSFSFNDIGKYFSALSNEANIRGIREAWLFFGVNDKAEIVNTNFRVDGNLQNLKKEIATNTNERLTFLEIYEVKIDKMRVIAFQVPPAVRGIPTTWHGATYGREGEHLSPLPLNKLDLIRAQIGTDWSSNIVQGAKWDNLDPRAVEYAVELFLEKQKAISGSNELLSNLNERDILTKAGVLSDGEITNAAMLLLGKEESFHYFDGFIPRITWSLYGSNGLVKAYEHIDMPMIFAVDKVYNKIRNELYRYIPGQGTLFPDVVDMYNSDVVKEILNNCIAHSNYQLRGKINVLEFEDKLVFMNEGDFIPETVERTLEEGYRPPYYRNTFLCRAMVSLNMIDTNSMGIPMMYQIQRQKYFPLPSYDLETPNRVKVTLYGKVLSQSYTRLLHANEELDLRTVFLLDKIQKKEVISKEDYTELKKRGLAEGRYPNVFVSYKVADLVGGQSEYIRNSGLDDDIIREFVLKAVTTFGEAKTSDIVEAVGGALPAQLEELQKSRKISNTLQYLKRKGLIETFGKGAGAKWRLPVK
jgi:ATP-dependent DNA helicase RecG